MDLSTPLCLLSVLLFGYGYAQTLVIDPAGETIKKEIGKTSIALSCSVQNMPDDQDPNIEWLDKADKVIGGYEPTGIRNRIFVMNLGAVKRLTFNALENGDEGTYTCRANINGQTETQDRKLELYDAIKVHSKPLQQPVIYTDALIECNATANPVPSVLWLYGKNMSIIEANKEGSRYRTEKKGIVITNITKEYDGLYFCVVTSSSNPEIVNFAITVQVTVPPKMKGPANFDDPIVGQKFVMSCEADGTPPPKFRFKKDGQVLDGEKYKVDVESNQLFERGTLTIEDLLDEDEGEYSCEAYNAGGTVTETVFIDTILPPVVAPIVNKTAAEGSTVELICRSRSDPEAVVQWQITGSDVALSDDPEKGLVIETETEELPMIHVVTKKLKFTSLAPVNTNNYTCTASNQAGSDTKDGSVVVEFKPNFENTPYGSTYGWENHNTEITCVVDAVPTPSVTWTKAGDDRDIVENGVYSIKQIRGVRQFTSILTVNVNIENLGTIFGTYVCKARNMHGPAEYNIELVKAVRPGIPIVSLEDSSPTTIDLLIVPPEFNGYQPILDYKIVYQVEGDPSTQQTKMAPMSADPNEPRTRYTIEGLRAQTTYRISTAARNNVGYGEAIDVTDTTPAVQVPGQPEIESISHDSANNYILSWKKPLTGGSELTGYNIRYTQVEVKEDNVKEVSKIIGETKTLQIREGSRTSHKLNSLMPEAYYELQLTAINSIGESMAGTQIFKTNPGGVSSPSLILLEKIDYYDAHTPIDKKGGATRPVYTTNAKHETDGAPTTQTSSVALASPDSASVTGGGNAMHVSLTTLTLTLVTLLTYTTC